MNPAHWIISPSDCLIGFCTPKNSSSYNYNRRMVRGSDFSRRYPWYFYEQSFIKTFRKVLPHIKQMGVKVKTNFGFNTFKKAFASEVKVIILFAHWIDDEVEFFDGPASSEKILTIVPENYAGFIDLCVCNPDSLAFKIRDTRPYIIVREKYGQRVIPAFWLHYYRVLFLHLASNKMTYLEASEKTYHEFNKKIIP